MKGAHHCTVNFPFGILWGILEVVGFITHAFKWLCEYVFSLKVKSTQSPDGGSEFVTQ